MVCDYDDAGRKVHDDVSVWVASNLASDTCVTAYFDGVWAEKRV